MGYGLGRASELDRGAPRTVVVASADRVFRHRLGEHLASLRWEVREAAGGADAMAHLESSGAEALLLDSWLPDLEVEEFAGQMRSRHPHMDLLRIDGGFDDSDARSPRRNELLHALRHVQSLEDGESDGAGVEPRGGSAVEKEGTDVAVGAMEAVRAASLPAGERSGARAAHTAIGKVAPLPHVIGESACMRELARMVRLVAPRSTTVLIEGDTGTGKELIAQAVHLLSARAGKPYVVLNCAAIPESLLEAELFGHTRGAFTGAVQSRTGRVEAANGGTLFLDEIGEMPLALQAKMLRFLESGEIQRVGGNETMRVDVRIVAATHQPLKVRTQERAFRLDLYHRLAVFPVAVPSLRERMEDVMPLAAFFLEKMGEEMPVKRLSPGAARRLMTYAWPGNVRELAHVLERASILAEDRLEIAEGEIQL